MYQTEPPAAYWRDQLIQWGPRVVFAILILIATHFIAKARAVGGREADRPHAGAETPSAGWRGFGRNGARPPRLLAGLARRS